ncbi:molybdenum cofactor biosynthesis protein MoaE, partial [Alphaproteobacteria bacterium]|nr:molybdenum cofactor biosynthesis protein MoaE [Alphaproteobacteria bacterium]
MIKINIQPEDFDVTSEIKSLRGRAIGAIATFSGIVRENSDSKSLISLTLEHYPGMSEKALDKIARQAMHEWPIEAVRIIHRIGRLTPEDNIVFVGCASAHRHAAFDGCRFI